IQEMHDTPFSGHMGFDKIYQAITTEFYWPNMTADICRFVSSCETCQRYKTPPMAPSGTLQPLPIPTRNWDHIGMDFITALSKTKGKDVILVFVDCLSKQAHFVPTITTVTAPETTQIFIENIF